MVSRKTNSTKKKQHVIPERVKFEIAANVPTEGYYCNIRHSVNIGDLWAAMGAMKKYYDITKRKVVILQQKNLAAHYYAGATHPTVSDDGGQMVTMNTAMFDMCVPLVESQEYIYKMEPYEGQRIDLDFDVIRQKTFVNLPAGLIQGWVPLAFPDLAFDISQSWITVLGKCPAKIKKQVQGKIIINFTERYRNNMIDYFFLKNYVPDLIFAGTDREHWLFCNRWQLSIPRLEIDNFLELGHALKESRFCLANQSQLINLAEALKTKRVMEICSYAQNCPMMIGEDSYGYFHQTGVEYYFKVLYNKTLKNPQ